MIVASRRAFARRCGRLHWPSGRARGRNGTGCGYRAKSQRPEVPLGASWGEMHAIAPSSAGYRMDWSALHTPPDLPLKKGEELHRVLGKVSQKHRSHSACGEASAYGHVGPRSHLVLLSAGGSWRCRSARSVTPTTPPSGLTRRPPSSRAIARGGAPIGPRLAPEGGMVLVAPVVPEAKVSEPLWVPRRVTFPNAIALSSAGCRIWQ